MSLTNSVLVSVRLHSRRVSARRISTTPSFLHHPNAQSFSLLSNNTCLNGTRQNAFRLFIAKRNYTKSPDSKLSSSEGESIAASVPPESVSPVSGALNTAPTETTPTGMDNVVTDLGNTAASYLPPALQYGDLAALGLAGWSPAGLMRWSFEIINVTTSLPWFWTIVAGTVFWKAVTIPINIIGLRNSARMLPIQNDLKAIQDKIQATRVSGDRLEMQKQTLKMKALYTKAGVSISQTMLVPLVQIPVTLGLFFGVKNLCAAALPQLQHSGFFLVPDLTAAAGAYLATALCAAANAQISIGSSEMNIQQRPNMGHIMNGLRILSVAGIFVMYNLPAGLLVSLIITSSLTTLQSLVMRNPSVRHFLKIPTVAKEHQGKIPTMLESWAYVRQSLKKRAADAQAEARRQQFKRQ